MKKITTTKTTVVTGFDDDYLQCAGPTDGTITDYVSDNYTTVDYTEDYIFNGFDGRFDHDDVAVANYTYTLRNIRQDIESAACKLEDAWGTFEVHSTLIEGDGTLDEDNREKLSRVYDDAESSLYALHEECDNAISAINDVLDAFKRLPMAE